MKKIKGTGLLFLFLGTALFLQAQDDRRPPVRKQYNIRQATSDRAQLHTIAFNGLAYITGSFGADCFFPPGKVADYFGFQFMRDNDSNSLGHNTDFLTRIATNVLGILNKEQMDQFVGLARQQEGLYEDFARKRIVLIHAFRRSMEEGRELNREAVLGYFRELYGIDAELSYQRAATMAAVIRSFTPDQILQLDQLRFSNSASWPDKRERLDKQSMSHRAHVAVMTYASELFSWYKGSLEADIYFCPERHGTYFGGFFLKDYPAMGNRGYSIPTSLTGESGKTFLEILDPSQRKLVEELPVMQKKGLDEIVRLRGLVAQQLRGMIKGEKPDQQELMEMIRQYGVADGELSLMYLQAFAAVNRSLTSAQRDSLKKLRNLDVVPEGIYIYSDKEPMPEKIADEFLLQPEKGKRAF